MKRVMTFAVLGMIGSFVILLCAENKKSAGIKINAMPVHPYALPSSSLVVEQSTPVQTPQAPTQASLLEEPRGILSLWQRSHPDFHAYHRLKNKALLTAEENEALEKDLSDKSLLQLAENILRASEEKKYHEDSMIQRLFAIEYLQDALRWKQNPVRQDLIEKTVAFLAEGFPYAEDPESFDLDLRRSLFADRLEVLKTLFFQRPQVLTELSQKLTKDIDKRLIQAAISAIDETTRENFSSWSQSLKTADRK